MNLTDLIWLIGLGPGRPASLFFGLALQAMGRKADPKKREEYFFSSVTQGRGGGKKRTMDEKRRFGI
ncbi:hypothetical protein SBV1_70002 [Verrucomicrobia bacterium]|nr:hypothetical protein SBV1_70002 [Verrucomicrobiota bacterium]